MRRLFLVLIALGVVLPLMAKEHRFVVKSGDNLTRYFHSLGLSDSLLINLLNSSNKVKILNNLRVGRTLTITTTNNKFNSLRYSLSKNKELEVILQGYHFFHRIIDITQQKSTIDIDKRELRIVSNLSDAVSRAHLSYKHLRQMLDIIKDRINPHYLKKGDIFTVFLRDNTIVALEFNQQFKWYFWQGLFYDANGRISSNMFLSAPLKYSRISSGFTLSRYHPILKIRVPHRAIDYAAPKGTPVRATADGVIKFRGYKGALGNAVSIKHLYGYETVYAHLSRFKSQLHQGQKVKQGEIIGYVGSTGRSTGNHLHYELKKNGEYKNPLKHKPQLVFTLKGKEKQEFLQFIKVLQQL